MTPREWVEMGRRYYDDGWGAFDLDDQGRVLAVLEAAVRWGERMDMTPQEFERAEIALDTAVAALPGEDAP